MLASFAMDLDVENLQPMLVMRYGRCLMFFPTSGDFDTSLEISIVKRIEYEVWLSSAHFARHSAYCDINTQYNSSRRFRERGITIWFCLYEVHERCTEDVLFCSVSIFMVAFFNEVLSHYCYTVQTERGWKPNK
jgi:hypothetical protein